MTVYTVNVKWGKEKLTNIQVDTGDEPMLFKASLFSLTGVQPHRQKVMVKGTALKDDSWEGFKLTNNCTLLMMGTCEELPEVPGEKTMFVEDMTEGQLAKVLELPSGLTNLGNTCYMNATLQCLRSVPEMRDAFKSFQPSSNTVQAMALDPSQTITTAMKELFRSMERSQSSIPPIFMLNILHAAFPQFAEKNEHGQYQQQDANECWVELVRCLQKKLPLSPPPTTTTTTTAPTTTTTTTTATDATKGFIDKYFSGELKTTMKSTECDDESILTENFYQLSCFIEKEVKYLHTGLKAGLEGEIMKHSETLQRDSKFLKTSQLTRLPSYLTVQMVRFFYKEKNALSVKILKDIKYPMSLDVYDLCTKELRLKLQKARDAFKKEEDDAVDKKIEEETDQNNEAKQVAHPYSFPDDPGSNNSGYYELQAVLTHKGRSSNSGHYVAWVKSKKKDEWVMFDDENVTAVTPDDILKLSGGGDWHCAYVLLYGPKILYTTPE